MRISDWSSDVCSSDLAEPTTRQPRNISNPANLFDRNLTNGSSPFSFKVPTCHINCRATGNSANTAKPCGRTCQIAPIQRSHPEAQNTPKPGPTSGHRAQATPVHTTLPERADGKTRA